MKRGKIKRGGAGILAIALACGMVFTSFGSLTTYADEEHYDTVAPVIDDVNVDDLKQIYAQGENVTFKVHAYDEGGSGMERMEMRFYGKNVDDETEIDSVYSNVYFNGEYNNCTYIYDENSGYYTFSVPVSMFKMGYSYTLSELIAHDGAENYVYADSAVISDKVIFTVEDVKNDNISIKSLDITDENGESVIGKTIDNKPLNFSVALSEDENIQSIYLEFKHMCDGAYSNSVVDCYKTDYGKFTYDGYTLNPSYSNDIVEYRLVEVRVRYEDGKEERISLADGFDNISISLNPATYIPVENDFTVESVKFYKNDGTEVKNADIVTQGDTLKVRVKTSGINEKYTVDGSALLNLYTNANKVNSSRSVNLTQDVNDNNLFEGTLEVDTKMYPTVWKASSFYICQLGQEVYEVPTGTVSFLVQSKSGDLVVPTYDIFNITYYVWHKDTYANGNVNVWYQAKSMLKEKIPMYTKLSELDLNLPQDVECPLEGGKFIGWHVFRDVYDVDTSTYTKVDVGSVEDYVIDDYSYVSIYPVFDKEFYVVSGSYYTDSGIEDFNFIEEGQWEEEKSIANANSRYSDKFDSRYGFKGYKLNYSSGDVYNLAAVVENKKVTVNYNYLGEDGKVKYENKEKFIPADKFNSEAVKSFIYSFECPKDTTKEAKFDNWQCSDIPSDSYITGSNYIYISAQAKYTGKYVAVLHTDNRLKLSYKYLLVDEDISKESLQKLVVDNRPSDAENEGLEIDGWTTYIPDEMYNFMSISDFAKIKNVVVKYNIHGDEVDELSLLASQTKYYKVGDTVEIPKSLGNYNIKKWTDKYFIDNNEDYEEFEEENSFVAKEAGVYYLDCYLGDYTLADNTDPAPDPDPTPDPEPKPEPKPEPNPDPTPTPVEKPVIKLDDTTVTTVVSKVESAVEEAKKEAAKPSSEKKKTPKVEIDMGKATVVPVDVLEAAKGADVDVVLKMDGYSWTINGEDIKGVDLKDINLEVSMNTNVVPTGLVSKLAGDKPTMQLSLTHNGDFGFKATLNLEVGKENAGQFGNLYYYDSDGKLVFMNAGRIAEDGSVDLSFSHASDYVIVIGEDMTPAAVTNPTKKAVKTNDSNDMERMIMIMLIGAACLTSVGIYRKKTYR